MLLGPLLLWAAASHAHGLGLSAVERSTVSTQPLLDASNAVIAAEDQRFLRMPLLP